MQIVFLIGRIIFGLFWLSSGWNHLSKIEYMSQYAKAKGTPAPKLAVGGTGVLLTLAGLSLLLGVFPYVGIALLIVFLLGVSFKMHDFWNDTDPQMRQINQINFMKNLALLGALLMLLLLPLPWSMSVPLG